MKKKVILSIFCVSVLAGGILVKHFLIGSKPFRHLSSDEVISATVELYPPDVTLQLTADEIEQLVPILNRAVIYRRDDTYGQADGQAVIFTLTKTDGTRLRVQAYNPSIVIDGVGYRTKYGPCQELNSLGNKLNSSYR